MTQRTRRLISAQLYKTTRRSGKLRTFNLCVKIFNVNQRFELFTEPTEHKKRLEDFLFDRFRTLSKLYLRDLVKNEKCVVNGRFENRGFRLRSNDFIEIELDPQRQNSMMPEDIPLEIVREDAELIIINKPAGMLVHPSHRDKSGTVLNALSHYLNRRPDRPHVRPGLVHRLDKETSGLLLIAKNTRAHARLAMQLEKKTAEKKYLALVDGIVKDDAGTIDAPIGRYAEIKMWAVKPDGKISDTRFRVLERYTDATMLELEPVTGRTNQLRIHCAALGHPIIGDVSRGGREFGRLCLHANRLAFRHPSTGERIDVEAPIDFGYN